MTEYLEALRATYRSAAEHHGLWAATTRDRRHADEIGDRLQDTLQTILDNHEQDYDRLIDAARSRLFDRAAKRHLTHPAPRNGPPITREMIADEARRDVQQSFEAERQRAVQEAERALADLLTGAKGRSLVRGLAKTEFNSAGADRPEDRSRQRAFSRD